MQCFQQSRFKAASGRAQRPQPPDPRVRPEVITERERPRSLERKSEAPALTVITKACKPAGVFKRITPLPAPGNLTYSQIFSRTGSSGDRKAPRESLPPRPDPPLAAPARMESPSAHPAAPEAPPHFHSLIGSGDRPPERRLWIGQLGCRSALSPGARGGRDHASYVGTLGRLRRRRNRGPERRSTSLWRSCYGVEFAARTGRDAAVAAMKVRDRRSRAVPPRLSYPATAPELLSFLLGGTSPETSAEGRPDRPASGSLTDPRPISWVPQSPQLPQRLRAASPRSGERPGAPCAPASGLGSAPGPGRALGGLRQTLGPRGFAHSVPLPAPSP